MERTARHSAVGGGVKESFGLSSIVPRRLHVLTHGVGSRRGQGIQALSKVAYPLSLSFSFSNKRGRESLGVSLVVGFEVLRLR